MKSLLLTFALLTSAPLALAQTTAPTKSTPVNTTAPFQVDLLPFGTVTLADGSYYIPDYQGTGIGVYIQSPTPLKIATLEETVGLQARWTRFLTAPTATATAVTPPAVQTVRPPMQTSAPVSEPVTPLAVTPTPAPLATVASAPLTTPAPSAPALQAMPLPNALKLGFKSRKEGNTYIITYTVTNTSQASVTFDPAQLVLTQDGAPLAGQLSIRNDSGTGQLLPRSAQIGVITVPARSQTPITLNWKLTDAQGKQWPITYAWQPQ